jgi:hypothetical protein
MLTYETLMLKRRRKQVAMILTYLFPVFFLLMFIDIGLSMIWIGVFGEIVNVAVWSINRKLKRLESA